MSVPALRFPEFSKPLKHSQIGDFGHFYYGKSAPKHSLSKDAPTPCVRYGELYSTFSEVITEIKSFTNIDPRQLKFSSGGEVLVPRVGEDPLDFSKCSLLTLPDVAIGEMISVFDTNQNGLFVTYLFRTQKYQFAKMVEGGSVSNLYFRYLEPIKVYLPSLPEQKKIAAFLGVVDDKLSALKSKRDLLGAYKRGLMQKLFSQELRFTKPNGQPFPDWEEKRLGEVFERVVKKNSKNNTNVLTISGQQGLINQKEYFNKSVSAKDVTGYYLLEKGQFAYNKSYSKGYPMGAIKRLNRYEQGVVSTLYICFSNPSETTSQFYEQFFESGGLNHSIHKIAQEGARNHGLLNVSVVEFFKDIRLPYPHPDEQQKIADALSALDAKISAVADQVARLEEFKKGLLQQMFV